MTDMSRSVHTVLAASFARVFGYALTLDTESTALTIAGWDSFKYVQVILEMETQYGIELDGPDIDDVANFGDLVALITRKIVDRPGQ